MKKFASLEFYTNFITKYTYNMVLIALVEALLVYFIWNYSLPVYAIGYSKIFLLLIGYRIFTQSWKKDLQHADVVVMLASQNKLIDEIAIYIKTLFIASATKLMPVDKTSVDKNDSVM